MQHSIEDMRKECQMTKKAMADALGLPSSTYESYENGKSPMPAYIFSAICDYFEVSRDNVKIPLCKQSFKKPMGNRQERTSFVYKKGFNEGFNEGLDAAAKKMNKAIGEIKIHS